MGMKSVCLCSAHVVGILLPLLLLLPLFSCVRKLINENELAGTAGRLNGLNRNPLVQSIQS